MKVIESFDEWSALSETLQKGGYELSQMQYDINNPEGFHAWFWTPKSVIEVMTHNDNICKGIVGYNQKIRKNHQ